ncbi:MAG: hypothetical protein KME64_36190 [Scytonematopsis contorta HA4267-MV1]|nr:hypothetical protein [Scytonematopsis contorta HA4267-MV1]
MNRTNCFPIADKFITTNLLNSQEYLTVNSQQSPVTSHQSTTLLPQTKLQQAT